MIIANATRFGNEWQAVQQAPNRLPLAPPHWAEGSVQRPAFLRQLGQAGTPRIAEIIVELGRTLGLRVLAEGIEDRAAWDTLQAMGCHEGQGYFISKPLEPERLLPWIAAYCASLDAPLQASSI